MKVGDWVVEAFRYRSRTAPDCEGHGHPTPEHDATESLLRIISDEGLEGYAFGASMVRMLDPFHRANAVDAGEPGCRHQPL